MSKSAWMCDIQPGDMFTPIISSSPKFGMCVSMRSYERSNGRPGILVLWLYGDSQLLELPCALNEPVLIP